MHVAVYAVKLNTLSCKRAKIKLTYFQINRGPKNAKPLHVQI